MKRLLFISLFSLTSCSILGPTYTGKTITDGILKSDVENSVRLFFRSKTSCNPEKIHTEIVNVKMTPDRSKIIIADEIWTTSGCNKTLKLKVRMRANEMNDGTDFGILELK
ncbi:hypothetical protein EV697_1033 [Bisgaardia hudsonensis]|uniref:Lipoprotein n=1 Tax=Bisgaardia hudsonensis TaxID=109472 RepID=A0A4V2SJ21_9PAST|nr:hypothetical protein [Bisgaardia hudsonensis]QLB13303.1 hypothetical protein A6A11_06640 [Bisgaardia hudsonensis]TCP12700.1 hypothetical protein EV697_1033 [Bisgaardia hudsonensis]